MPCRVTQDGWVIVESCDKNVAPWKERYVQPRQHIEKQRHHFADKDWYSQSYGFFQ